MNKFGLKQIPDNAEYANATLVHKNKNYYLFITCYLPKEQKELTGKKEHKVKTLDLQFGRDYTLRSETIDDKPQEVIYLTLKTTLKFLRHTKYFSISQLDNALSILENIQNEHSSFGTPLYAKCDEVCKSLQKRRAKKEESKNTLNDINNERSDIKPEIPESKICDMENAPVLEPPSHSNVSENKQEESLILNISSQISKYIQKTVLRTVKLNSSEALERIEKLEEEVKYLKQENSRLNDILTETQQLKSYMANTAQSMLKLASGSQKNCSKHIEIGQDKPGKIRL